MFNRLLIRNRSSLQRVICLSANKTSVSSSQYGIQIGQTPQFNRFYNTNIRYFSAAAKPDGEENEEIVIEKEAMEFSQQEKRVFQAETKRLLDIVAKSIYTDREVFVRELLSNCSDALEKQRFAELKGEDNVSGEGDLRIELSTNSQERTITLFDSGIGMTKDEAINNLGTIAKSGSSEFLQQLEDTNQSDDAQSSIIGQFGVGFYSSFIVADNVEVFTKKHGHEGVAWVSDGSGEFMVSDATNLGFERGTKIVIKLKPDAREFSQESEIEKIVAKFSQFITYPIRLNGQQLNQLQAIWYREKREVTDDEYERFYEQIANTKIPFKFKQHFSADVPLSIRALLYAPSHNNERMGMPQEAGALDLYCRKVLIKANCTELLPQYLRFLKGVIDCEDLPLNISRETYQDSSLIAKLRNVITRRAIKMLEDEAKKDPAKYNTWYQTFHTFLKEGTQLDQDNKDAIFRLLRFSANCTTSQKEVISLDQYIDKMPKGQSKIYFTFGQSIEAATSSPFYEPFKAKDVENVPVLILTQQLDEFCLTQSGDYKGKKFVNIEQVQIDEVRKELGLESADNSTSTRLPEEDVTNFCLWLKDTLSSKVAKVSLSRRLTNTPAILVGQMSSSMYMMMQMLQASGQMPADAGPAEMPKDLTLEINASHPTILNLNTLRKSDPEFAQEISLNFLDQILTSSSIPFDAKEGAFRNQKMMEGYLTESILSQVDAGATRRTVEEATFEPVDSEPIVDDSESILSQAHRDVRGANKNSEKMIVNDYKVTGDEKI